MTAETCAVTAVPISSETFRAVFRQHPSGVAVISLCDGDDGGRPVGFTATSVISVSADPPVLAFSVASTSSSWPTLQRASTLVVNFLGVDQVDVSARFATSGVDRFAGVDWYRLAGSDGRLGEPVLAGVPAWLRGRIATRTAAGSSFLITVEILEAHDADDHPRRLVYHDRRYHQLDDSTSL